MFHNGSKKRKVDFIFKPTNVQKERKTEIIERIKLTTDGWLKYLCLFVCVEEKNIMKSEKSCLKALFTVCKEDQTCVRKRKINCCYVENFLTLNLRGLAEKYFENFLYGVKRMMEVH